MNKSKSKVKRVNAYCIVIKGKLDVNYDIYESKKLAKKYNNSYRIEDGGVITTCTIEYKLPTQSKK